MASTTRVVRNRRKGKAPVGWRAFLPVLVVLAGVVAYCNSFSGAFVFDDQSHIVEDTRIRHLQPIWDLVSDARRPVVKLSLAVNYALDGLNVWGYHVFNLAVHILAGLTLFGVVRRTLLRRGLRDRYGPVSAWLATVVAVIWVVHPLQTQSVTYIIQRGEALMGLFYLLTLYCVIRGVDSARAHIWYGLAVVACALGMGSKAVMVTAPVLVLLYDRTFLSSSFAELARRRWGLYLGLAATWGTLAVFGVAQGVLDPTPRYAAGVGFAFKGIMPLEYALTQPGVILHYLKLSLWPVGLCIDYDWPIAKTVAATAVPGCVLVILLAATVWALVRRPWLGFAGAWFFVVLAPTSSFVPVKDVVFEHRMYLPLAAVVVLVVTGAYEVLGYFIRRLSLPSGSQRAATAVPVVAVVTLLCWATIARNRDYRSEADLWKSVVAVRPNNARAHTNIGLALIQEGKIPEGMTALNRALELDPTNANAHNGYGIAFAKLGRIDEALEAFNEALRIRWRFAEARFNLGKAFAARGQLEEAVEQYRIVIDWHTPLKQTRLYVDLSLNLGTALYALGRVDEAIEAFREAVQSDPEHAAARENLGTALLDKGKAGEAIRWFRRALLLDRNSATARNGLGIALVHAGRIDEAVAQFERAIQLDPDMAMAHFNLGLALSNVGRTDEAVEAYQRTLRIDPNHAGAKRALEALGAGGTPP
jgi:tetratricopeptide (TPR) repeat protein